jgi:predicted DNA binding CopG/RHH family protein
MRKSTKLKKLPSFKSDREAEDFVDRSDLSKYDLSGGEFVRFEMKPKDKSLNLRLPSELLDTVRRHAKRAGIPYQRYIRMALERAIRAERS